MSNQSAQPNKLTVDEIIADANQQRLNSKRAAQLRQSVYDGTFLDGVKNKTMSKSNDDLVEKIVALAIIIVIGGTVFGIEALAPLFEAQSYNKLTGGNATYWDALWVELRVQECTTTNNGGQL